MEKRAKLSGHGVGAEGTEHTAMSAPKGSSEHVSAKGAGAPRGSRGVRSEGG